MATGDLIRLVRTVAGLPRPTPGLPHIPTGTYSLWFCVTCGHPHHGMTRHHRLPKRVAWKIPSSIWREVLKGDQRIVPMCSPCHHYIETGKKGPCPEKLSAPHAKLTWIQLREEIRIFDQIAYERTEALITKCKAEEG